MLPRESLRTPCSWLLYCVISVKDASLLCLISMQKSEVATFDRKNLQPTKLNTTARGILCSLVKCGFLKESYRGKSGSSSHSGFAADQGWNSESAIK